LNLGAENGPKPEADLAERLSPALKEM